MDPLPGSNSRRNTRLALTRYGTQRWQMVFQLRPNRIRLVLTNTRIRFLLSLYLEATCFFQPGWLLSIGSHVDQVWPAHLELPSTQTRMLLATSPSLLELHCRNGFQDFFPLIHFALVHF